MKTLNGIAFNAEPEQAAGAQGELTNAWVSDEPRHLPTCYRGLSRRRHQRQPPARPTRTRYPLCPVARCYSRRCSEAYLQASDSSHLRAQ